MRAPSPKPLGSQAGLAKTSRVKPPAAGAVPRTRRPPSSRVAEVSAGRRPLGPSGPVSMPRPPLSAIVFWRRRAVAPGSIRTPSPPLSVIVLPRIWAPVAVDDDARARGARDRVAVVLAGPADLAAGRRDVDAVAVAADRVLRDDLGVVARRQLEARVAGAALERVEEDLGLMGAEADRVARRAHDRVVGDVDVGVLAEHDAVAGRQDGVPEVLEPAERARRAVLRRRCRPARSAGPAGRAPLARARTARAARS